MATLVLHKVTDVDMLPCPGLRARARLESLEQLGCVSGLAGSGGPVGGGGGGEHEMDWEEEGSGLELPSDEDIW